MAGALLTLALLAGCGDPTTTPRALPKITTSAVPVAVVGDATPQGAADFARHFFAQITKAFATADPTLVSALSRPGCTTCDAYVASLTKLRDNRERVSPVSFTVHFAEAPATDGKTARVDVQYSVPASKRYDAAGRVIYTERASVRVNATVKLLRLGSSWRVVEVL